jgi:hypothetical protein
MSYINFQLYLVSALVVNQRTIMHFLILALLLSFSSLSQATELKTTGATSRPAVIAAGLMATQDVNCNILLVDTKNHRVVDTLKLATCTPGEFSKELLFKENALFGLSYVAGKESVSYSLAKISVKEKKLGLVGEFHIQLPKQRAVSLRNSSVLETAASEVGFLVSARTINSEPVETDFISIDSKLLGLKLHKKIPNKIVEVSTFDKASHKAYFSSQSGQVYSYSKEAFSKLMVLPTGSFKDDLARAGYNPQDYNFRVQGINILSEGSLVIDANAGIYVIKNSDLSLQTFSALELGQLSRADSLAGIRGGWGSKSIPSPSNDNIFIPFDSGFFSVAVLKNKVLIEKLSVKDGYSLNRPNGIPAFVNENLLFYQIGNEIASFRKVGESWVSTDSRETNIRTPGSSSWILYTESHIWAGYIHPSLITAHEI